MFAKTVLFSFLLAIVFAENLPYNYEYTNLAKKCMETMGIREGVIRMLVPEMDDIQTDNETVLKFFGCIFDKFLTYKGELTVNDEFRDYVAEAFAFRMNDAKYELVKLVAEDCIDHCKYVKGETKDISAVKIMNCLKNRLHLYVQV